jgi:3-dehydroshikimate dehydratase
MITLTLCSIAFRNEPIENLIPRIAQTGFAAVEIFGQQIEGKSDEELKKIKTLADKHRLKVLVLAPYFSFTRTREGYQESIERAKKFVHYCHVLDTPKIRTFTDVGPKGVSSQAATPEQWQQGIEGLQTIAALDRKIMLVLETHDQTLVNTTASTLRVLREVHAPNVKVLFQPTTFLKEGIIPAYDQLFPHIDHLHLNNHNPQDHSLWIEKGEVDYPVFFQHLQRTNYQGSASLEYCHDGATWEKVESGYKYIRKYL